MDLTRGKDSTNIGSHVLFVNKGGSSGALSSDDHKVFLLFRRVENNEGRSCVPRASKGMSV